MLISIVFVHYGQNLARSNLAKKSLNSLYESVKHLPCEIIVVDNGYNLQDSFFFLQRVEEKKITHYIRNADNLWFGKARNQAYAIAEGDYIVTCDNDLMYKEGWLDICLSLLDYTKGTKLMATPMPILYCHKKYNDKEKIRFGEEDFFVNPFVGSNCWVMHKEDYLDIGGFIDDPFAGTRWCQKYAKKLYAVICANKELVEDVGDKHMGTFGYKRYLYETNQNNDVQIKKTLINGDEIIYYKGDV